MKGRIRVTLTPLGDKIKYFVRGSRLYCAGMQNEIRRSMTLHRDDWIFRLILGSELNVKKFLKQGKTKTVITRLTDLMYDDCDSTGHRGIKHNWTN